MSPEPGEAALVVVANRLPVERVLETEGGGYARSPGGLVSALTPIVRELAGAWIGWDGVPDGGAEPFTHDGIHLDPVPLSTEEVTDFYDGFANATLWPLFHDIIVKPQFHRQTWTAYRRVNERFAEHVARSAGPGATVWVHDYQLALVPALVRARRPDLTIGYFNHIPFPPYEIFAQLPWGQALVAGLLGADLLGFQRAQDANNFLRACRRAHGVPTQDNSLEWTDPDGSRRRVVARHYPIGIAADEVIDLARKASTARQVREFREQIGDRRVLLGVDRLDYTKGIAVRLRAVEELLADGILDPNEVVVVQVGTPSRERVDAYQDLRDEIELAVGRINGSFSTLSMSPVVYLRSTVALEELVALYRLADVMLVTPLRDGMNLVAKEFIACRTGNSGVLVLSRFAGASDVLVDALLVNPYDLDGVKEAIVRAVRMPLGEQRRRMRALRAEVIEHDVTWWAQRFLHDLRAMRFDTAERR